MNIILAGLGLGSVAFGAWFVKYRYFLYAFTFTLLATSFYRIYFKHKGDVGIKTKVTLWIVAGMSLMLTTFSIIKNLRAAP
ncbi:MAG: hypothetical protein OEW15_14295 [Nitrospirota bacterium]|nr:hypothetical protein [Nitrospirota bacterium]